MNDYLKKLSKKFEERLIKKEKEIFKISGKRIQYRFTKTTRRNNI